MDEASGKQHRREIEGLEDEHEAEEDETTGNVENSKTRDVNDEGGWAAASIESGADRRANLRIFDFSCRKQQIQYWCCLGFVVCV